VTRRTCSSSSAGWRSAAPRRRSPGADDKRTLVELALKNASLKLDELLIARGAATRRVPDEVVELREALGMRDLPRSIECFDVSNFQGAQPVASLVHFEAGQPVKKQYRHFRIRGIVAPNDYAMMEHVVERHFRGAREAGRELPELVLVDGGRGQLAAALLALGRLGLGGHVTLAGLAKRNEELFLPGSATPLVLPRTSGALKLVQQVHDRRTASPSPTTSSCARAARALGARRHSGVGARPDSCCVASLGDRCGGGERRQLAASGCGR
jgi:excinuclease UvrABC nuclease subunit